LSVGEPELLQLDTETVQEPTLAGSMLNRALFRPLDDLFLICVPKVDQLVQHRDPVQVCESDIYALPRSKTYVLFFWTKPPEWVLERLRGQSAFALQGWRLHQLL
jgi:hypothetical protein